MPGVLERTRVPLAVARRRAPPVWERLRFDMQHQEQDQWCWAAVSTSIANHYAGAARWTQCRVAGAELGLATCCEHGAACNRSWYLDRALRRTNTLDRVKNSPPSDMRAVRSEIHGQRPLGVRIGWSGGGGHFVVVEGYRQDLGAFAVEDPWYGTSDVSAEALRFRYQGSGRWTHSYYTRRP
jgi:Papain-like cysteine protease AvrRpt2